MSEKPVTQTMPTTAQMLSEYPEELLEVIAEQRSASLEGNSRRQNIDALAAELTNSVSVLFAYEDAIDEYPLVQDAIDTLLKAGGEMAESRFSKEFGSVRQMGPSLMLREMPWLHPEGVGEVLYYLGLLGRGFRGAGQNAHTVVYLPSDVSPWLPRAQAEMATEGLPIVAAPPPPRHRTVAADDSLLEDAGSLLGFLISEPLRLEATGVNAEDLAHLVQRLQLPFDESMPDHEMRLALLLHLANRLGWLRRADGDTLALTGNRVREFLEKTRAEQRQALFQAWHSSQEWNDLCRTPGLHCDMAGSPSRNDPLQTRASVLALLARLQPTGWYSIKAVIAAIREVDPNFQRPTGRHDEWKISRAATGEPLVGIEHWMDVEGALLDSLLRGPLHWLGAVDLAEPAGGDEWLVSLTAWGARWLGLEVAQPYDKPHRPLQVTEDFRLLLPLGAPLFDRFRVERFAQWHSSYPQFVYQITQRSLKRAGEQKLSAQQILDFLAGRTTQLPPKVTAALRKFRAEGAAVASDAPGATASRAHEEASKAPASPARPARAAPP